MPVFSLFIQIDHLQLSTWPETFPATVQGWEKSASTWASLESAWAAAPCCDSSVPGHCSGAFSEVGDRHQHLRVSVVMPAQTGSGEMQIPVDSLLKSSHSSCFQGVIQMYFTKFPMLFDALGSTSSRDTTEIFSLYFCSLGLFCL